MNINDLPLELKELVAEDISQPHILLINTFFSKYQYGDDGTENKFKHLSNFEINNHKLIDLYLYFSIYSEDITRNLCYYASQHGNLRCLKYAYSNNCIWTIYTCSAAATNENLKCLKYAYENGCPWNEETCNNAATNGNLKCLKYAYENGCPWGEETCNNAAKYCNFDCLEYAYTNGCPYDISQCKININGTHLLNLQCNGSKPKKYYKSTYSHPYKKLKCIMKCKKYIYDIMKDNSIKNNPNDNEDIYGIF